MVSTTTRFLLASLFIITLFEIVISRKNVKSGVETQFEKTRNLLSLERYFVKKAYYSGSEKYVDFAKNCESIFAHFPYVQCLTFSHAILWEIDASLRTSFLWTG